MSTKHDHTRDDHAAQGPPAPEGSPERDPVCGMTVKPDSPHRHGHRGVTYRFCSAGCREKFAADPERWLSKTASAPSGLMMPVVEKGVSHRRGSSAESWICPMDPEVNEPSPGACPRCGMALEPETVAAPARRTEWTCPMHPQIVRDQPGSCPICGMALEPRTAMPEAEDDGELRDMTRRFWVSVALTVPLVVLAMGHWKCCRTRRRKW